jgi:ankyrin repeat protein
MEDRSRSVEQILESLSDVLFPDGSGNRKVELNSVGYDGDTPLHILAWRKDVDGIKTLIDAGADVNALGEMDETPLHIAVTNNRIDIAELLLSAGADMNIRCEFGDTPLERARTTGGKMAGLFDGYVG